MKDRYVLALVVFALLVLPQHASANAGTPLMWAGMIHLAVGNALIGLVEGLLLAHFFGLTRRKAVGIMILANYVSAWIGGLLIRGAIVRALPIDLTNAWRWLWIMVVVMYGLTILLEWPFVAWCFRGAQDWLKRSVRASFVIQSVSCMVLFGWYWLASGTSLYTRMDVVPPEEFPLPRSAMVYFISSSDGNVYQRNLASSVDSESTRICDLQSIDENDRLLVRPSSADTNRWDLVARLETDIRRNPRFVEVLTNLQVEAAPDWRSTHTDPPDYEGTWFTFGQVQGFPSATNSQWTFWAGFWPVEGLRATHEATGERVRFSYETPFGAWTVRNAVKLPNDKVIFQLGRDQICIFDPVERRVALLWHGRGPVVLIEKGMSNQALEATADPPSS
jgi:hypothetical protein